MICVFDDHYLILIVEHTLSYIIYVPRFTLSI